jgi:uncharacterized membrane protein YtjA (UPF0391 family)
LSPDVATGNPIQQDQNIESNKRRDAGLRAAGRDRSPARAGSPWNQRDRPPLDKHCAGAAPRRLEERAMTILKWALIFFVVSIVAGVLGFTDISAASADVARFLFYVFVVIFLVLLILGLTIFRV